MKVTFCRWGFEILHSRGRYFCFYFGWATQGYHPRLWHDGYHSALNLGPFSFGWGDD